MGVFGTPDTSEKIQTIKKWVGYEGDKVFSCKNFKTQNQFLLNNYYFNRLVIWYICEYLRI